MQTYSHDITLKSFLSTAVNQIEFGNKGELYINIGSNTNGGIPGRLSGSGQLKENYFSAATLVADLSDAKFDGFIEYDAPDDGSPINYAGVFVFAPGLRNPFGLTMHSNGNLYGTDNGPNAGYGMFPVW
jgi:glucose/arabinose dehydrogenase